MPVEYVGYRWPTRAERYDPDNLPGEVLEVTDLQDYLGISESKAETIHRIMTGEILPLDCQEFAATQKWVSECYHMPHEAEIALHAIDEVLENFGIEGWAFTMRSGVEYSNTGDSYASTVALLTNRDWFNAREWRLSSFGDLVEEFGDEEDYDE